VPRSPHRRERLFPAILVRTGVGELIGDHDLLIEAAHPIERDVEVSGREDVRPSPPIVEDALVAPGHQAVPSAMVDNHPVGPAIEPLASRVTSPQRHFDLKVAVDVGARDCEHGLLEQLLSQQALVDLVAHPRLARIRSPIGSLPVIFP
jgi:hypothetical protein